jgi:putative ABC transport system permease protein
MKFLLLHVLRSMWLIRYRMLVIAMICASTFGVLVGAYSAIDSLFTTVEKIQKSANMSDLELLFAADDRKNVPDFGNVPGVAKTVQRLILPGQVEFGGQRTVSGMFLGAPRLQFEEVNRLHVLSGALPSETDTYGVVLERNCATHYEVNVGATFPFKVGLATYKLIVRGIVESPEYLVAPLNPGIYVPTSGSLCVLFGGEAMMKEALGFPAVNSLLVFFTPGSDPATVKTAVIERAHTRLSVDYALLRSEQFSQKFLELDLNTFKVFLPTVVVIFALSSTLVVFFLMYQWVKEERPLIAMLLTLGYDQRNIVWAYLLPAVMIVALAVVMGMFVAFGDMWAFGVNYAAAIGMPAPKLRFEPMQILLAIGVVTVSVSAGMFLPLRSLLRISPIDALRDITASVDRVGDRLVVSAKAVGGPFWLQYALRNLARSWGVSLVSVITVAASLAVTIAFYVSLTSMEKTALGSFESDEWHAVVDLDAPLWSDEIERLQSAIPGSNWSTFVKGGAQVVSAGRLDNAYLIGIDPAGSVRHPNILTGRMLDKSDSDAVVIERRLAVDHQLEVGAMVELKVRGESHKAKVVGILSGAVPGEVVATRAFAQRLLAVDDQFTGAFLVAPALTAERSAALYKTRGVVRVTGKQEITAAILSISKHIWIIIHLSAMMSIGVSALFMLTSIGFTIMGRRGEYGMLRIIGYRDGTVAKVVLSEAFLTALIAAAIAAPVGLFVGDILNGRLTDVWFKINTDPSLSDFLRIMLPALIFVPFAVWPAVSRILKIPAVETLKQRKFG